MDVQKLLEAVAAQEELLIQTIRTLVTQESPSDSRDGVNAACELVAERAKSLEATAKWHKTELFGDNLELRFGPARSRRKPILLLGHLDTVWPLGTLQGMPWRVGEGRLWGPGVLDMKAAVAMAITALMCLKELGLERPVTLLLNSDEEVGSLGSRALTERLALRSEAVFVLEPAQGAAYKTARKGVGEYNLRVTGVAAHSGVDFARGHSAVLELAKLVQTVSNFTDLSVQRTVNCGVFAGGTRPNVVAAQATAAIDVRIAKASDAARVDKLFRRLRCSDPGCTLEVTGGMNRPPMERRPATVALFKKAQRLARELGFDLAEAATGGGSDGNFTSALGVPTLDGMGAVGDGAHAAHESVLIEHLVPRTALLAAMIASV